MSERIACLLATFLTLLSSATFAAEPVSFRYDVLAALSRHGCSSGACHGSPTGKGGFRLSLRGFDPAFDEVAILREDLGRRCNVQDPDTSLLLAKPLMQVAHGGGQRLKKSDPAYALIRRWIAEGCRPDAAGRAQCVAVEVSPKQLERQLPLEPQSLKLIARFSDGSSRDVTHLAVFTSSDDEVARVDEQGLVTPLARGEAVILARYLDYMDTAEFTLLSDTPGFAWPNPPVHNYIDELVDAKLQKLQIPPSPLTSDHEFVRRIYLDVLGMLPTREEAGTFVADTSSDKRNRLIDELLQRPEHAEFWALKWADLLRVKSSRVGDAATHKMHRWLVDSLRENKPYDQLVRELLTASGSSIQNPPAAFYRATADVNDCAETAAQLLLGIRIQCAKCHNHPFDRWSQDNYHGIGAFFTRVGRKTTARRDETVVYSLASGEVVQPRTGQIVKPWLPWPEKFEVAEAEDRRQVLARYITSPENEHVAQVSVNRIWAHLMGRGIVEPVDDFRPSNPPSNAPLLAALARDFVQHKFDQRHLIRTILRSRTYQLSSVATEQNLKDIKYNSHAYARLMTAEQLLDAIGRVTGVPETFTGLPERTRAGQLPSPDSGNHFMKVFGQPGRETACACERSADPKLDRALQMISGPLLPQKLRDRRSKISRVSGDLQRRLQAAGQPPSEGLALWLRADAGVSGPKGSPASDSQPIGQWQDARPGKLAIASPTGSQQPIFVNEGFAGLPSIRFDGVDDLLTSDVNLLPAGSPRTVLAVARAEAGGHGGSLICFRRSNAGGTGVFAAQHVLVANGYYVYSDNHNHTGNSTLPRERFADIEKPFLSTFLSAGPGHKIRLLMNGTEQTVLQPGAVGVDDGAAGFTVGSREDIPPGAQNWQGDISELLVYDHELTADKLQAAGSYLTTKYDLTTIFSPRKVDQPATADELADARELVIDLYHSALARPPSELELKTALSHITTAEDRRQGLEDLFWAVMNSKEFLFQH